MTVTRAVVTETFCVGAVVVHRFTYPNGKVDEECGSCAARRRYNCEHVWAVREYLREEEARA